MSARVLAQLRRSTQTSAARYFVQESLEVSGDYSSPAFDSKTKGAPGNLSSTLLC